MISIDASQDPAVLAERRERVFLLLCGFFICSMTLLNVVGITKFMQLGPLALAVGVLPYPLTFLCTDIICEIYGRRRANYLVGLGLLFNIFIWGCLWLGNRLPAVSAAQQPPWQVLQLAQTIYLPNGSPVSGSVELYGLIYSCMSGAVFASMLAYIAAQFIDVQLFHFWKHLTRGKHLWLRNNFSTMVSQLVDSIVVIGVTFGALLLSGGMTIQQGLTLVTSSYLFKLVVALLDTGPFYLAVHLLRRYLQVPHPQEIGRL